MSKISNVHVNISTVLKDIKTSGTDGGTFTAGSFVTRTLNTQEGDMSFCVLNSNQFTLVPGIYSIIAWAGGNDCNEHRAKIRNITDSTDAILGTTEVASTVSNSMTKSECVGLISITSSKTFELQHRCSSTTATIGFGDATGFGESEVYAMVEITKIG